MKHLFLTLLCLIATLPAFSSHWHGGEITWTVDSLNRFIFKVVIYRDCNGVPGQNQVTLNTNAPVGNILCTLTQVNDISPVGPGCPTCVTPMGFPNAASEFIFHSQPTIISGTVPDSGYHFYFDTCCRNALIANLSDTGSGAFVLRAIMFKNSLGVIDGTDNSPDFQIPPVFGVCKNQFQDISYMAVDTDNDSITYEWGKPLGDASFNPYPFAAGYSFTSPLPSQFHNVINVPAVLNQDNGMMSFKSWTTGAFVIVIKVTSWKCGVKTAEIYREAPITIFTSCNITSNPAVPNTNPALQIILNGSNISNDTLIAGETGLYTIETSEPQLDTSGNFQVIDLSAYSPHFGTNFNDSLIGCLIPPCATLAMPSPQSGTVNLSDTLRFRSDCTHLNQTCLIHQRNYSFTFSAKDNYCPVPGNQFRNLLITVHGPVILQSANNLSVSYPGATFQWYLNGVPIPGATDSVITPLQGGIYSVIATLPGGCQMVSNAVNRTFAGINENRSNDFIKNLYVDENKNLHVIINTHSSQNVILKIHDVQGKMVKQIALLLTTGEQHIVVPVGELQTGVYLMDVQTSASRHSSRFNVN